MAAMAENCAMDHEGITPARRTINKKLPITVTKLYGLEISEKEKLVEIRLL
jgi:hypothetical protein